MSQDAHLGEPPPIEVEVLQDHGVQRSPQGFLGLRCVSMRARHSDGRTTEAFNYDVVERRFLDAVVMMLWRRVDGVTQVCLRSQLRPPLAFRNEHAVPTLGDVSAVLWELPAGLIESGEDGALGIAQRARAEALEETGFELAAERFEPLGPPSFPTPGLFAEMFHFVHCELHAQDVPGEPSGDGHAVEEGASVRFVSLGAALEAVERGHVRDAKTELGLRRLASRLERAE